jgi:hypothetical protein
MSTDQQQSTEESKLDGYTDDIATVHRQAQKSGEVFEGGPYSER